MIGFHLFEDSEWRRAEDEANAEEARAQAEDWKAIHGYLCDTNSRCPHCDALIDYEDVEAEVCPACCRSIGPYVEEEDEDEPTTGS